MKLEEKIIEKDKQLLETESVLGSVLLIFFIGLITIVSYVYMPDWIRFLIIISSVILLFIATFFLLKIEQKAGYYECKKCKNKYIPEYKSMLWAPHFGRTRLMVCPKCGKKSWQKKVLK